MTSVLVKDNVIWHQHSVNKQIRGELKQQHPCILWFTGLSGAGKSTIAGALEKELVQRGYHTYLLDGDNVRHGLCRDLGFSIEDRRENIRRIGEVAALMADAGLIVLSAFISPERRERQLVRDLVADGEFIEVFVDTSLVECERRDPKGLYKKARAGEIKQFTGIDSIYEKPLEPEIHLVSGSDNHIEDLVSKCVDELYARHIISK
ncbi:TPA: adenylyl-sulfate kinase [Photobacterium damselae]